MKNIIVHFFCLLLLSFLAEESTAQYVRMDAAGYKYKGLVSDTFGFAVGNGAPAYTPSALISYHRAGQYYDTANDVLYIFNPSTELWGSINIGTLTNTLTSAHIFIGNGSNIATDVALSGDASINNAGGLTNTGLRGSAIPSLAAGFLKYSGSAWIFDNTVYQSAFTGSQGDILYFSASNTLSNLAKNTTATRYLSNTGSSNNPAWAQIDLTNGVTGVLPIANGGTNSSTAMSGNSIMITNGTAIVQGPAGTTTTLLHGNAAGAPTYSAASLTADVTGTLPVANGGTSNSSLTAYALLAGGTTSTGALQQVSGLGTSGQVLTSSGPAALPTWTTAATGSVSNVYAPLIKSGDTISQRFNVLNYGADNTGATDATVAIQNTINAAAAAGGDVIVPVGVYKIAGPLQTNVGGINYNSQLYISASTSSNTSRNHVRIIGEAPPNFSQTGGLAGSSTPSTSGCVIFYSTLSSGSATDAAVIGTNKASGSFSYEYFSIENIMIKVKNNPSGSGPIIGGISCKNGPSVQVRNFVYTIDTAGPVSTYPGNEISGIETPDNGSEGSNIIENAVCIGAKNAFKVGEHVMMINSQSFVCEKSFNLKSGGHTSIAIRPLSQWCKNDIYVSASANLCNWTIIGLDAEWQQIGKWYDNIYTISDSASRAQGSVTYSIIVAGSTIDNTKFAKNGATVITNYPANAGLAALANQVNTFSYNGSPEIDLNTTSSTGSPALRWQRSGASKWTLGMDINGNGTNDFWLYDHANSKSRMYFNATGGVNIGGTATTGSTSIISLDGTNTTNKITVVSNGELDLGGVASAGSTAAIQIAPSNNNIGFNNNAMFYDAVNNRLSMGGGTSPSDNLYIKGTTNVNTQALIENTSSGTAGQATFRVKNNSGLIGQFAAFGSGYTTYGLLTANSVGFYSNASTSMVFMEDANAPIIFGTGTAPAVERMRITGTGNLLIGGTATPTSSAGNIVLYNGTAASGNATNGIILQSVSGELQVRDASGNVTTLSPHDFSGIKGGRSNPMAWAYYSERDGRYINVDMYKSIHTIELLSEEVEQLKAEIAELKNTKYIKKSPAKLIYTGNKK